MKRLLLVVAALLALAQPAQAQLSTNLTAYWACNESSTGSRADLHASNTLVEVNTVAAPATGLVYTNTCDWEEGDGGEFLEIDDNTDVSTGTGVSWTLVAWVRPESFTAGSAQIVSKDNGDGEIWLYYSGPQNAYYVRIWAAAGYGTESGVIATTFGTPGTGSWQMIAVTNTSGGNLCISVNAGAQDCASTSGMRDGIGDLRIGAHSLGSGQYWDGSIGPVVLWKRALSSGDITTVYNGGAGMTYAAMTGGGGPTCTGGFTLFGVGGC